MANRRPNIQIQFSERGQWRREEKVVKRTDSAGDKHKHCDKDDVMQLDTYRRLPLGT